MNRQIKSIYYYYSTLHLNLVAYINYLKYLKHYDFSDLSSYEDVKILATHIQVKL